ncbi:MAG: PadR family transcriptional regulator [Rhodothermaceae bacterium]
MKILTRPEEMVLLAVWKLKGNAYGVTLAEQLTEMTGQKWVLGAVYVPLERLEKKGYLKSYLSNPTKERGGRSKRMYDLTKSGLKALIDIKTLEEQMWNEISKVSLESEL